MASQLLTSEHLSQLQRSNIVNRNHVIKLPQNLQRARAGPQFTITLDMTTIMILMILSTAAMARVPSKLIKAWLQPHKNTDAEGFKSSEAIEKLKAFPKPNTHRDLKQLFGHVQHCVEPFNTRNR